MSKMKVNRIENTATTAGGLDIDSSGRLLVGTSSSPSAGNGQYAKLVVQGFVGGTGAAFASLQRAEAATSITTDELIGVLSFDDSSGNTFAEIAGRADGTAGASDYPGRLVFSTTADGAASPTEQMRIDSNGQIQMGRTSAVGDERLALQSTTGKCAYVFQGANANRNCMELRNTYAQGGQTAQMIRFVQANGAMVGQITSTASATSYLSGASDRRLKKNIEDWNEDILQHFKTLNPSKFNYLTEEDGDPKTKGYIAQDLAAAFPEAYPNLYDEDAGEDRYSYNPGGMVVYLMKALQEEIVKREALEQRLSDAGIA